MTADFEFPYEHPIHQFIGRHLYCLVQERLKLSEIFHLHEFATLCSAKCIGWGGTNGTTDSLELLEQVLLLKTNQSFFNAQWVKDTFQYTAVYS